MLGIPAGELFLLAGAIVAGGVLTGILAGLFGIGGGAIIVPVLIGFVSLIGFVLMALVSSFTAQFGVRLARRR